MSAVMVQREGPVWVIHLQRSEKRNAINSATALALREAWLALDADPSARVGVLTGGDEVFCAGADLSDLESLARDVEGESGPLGFTRLSIGKPTIAAIAGFAVAGGLELACWCDLRIGDDTAVLGCFERRFGVPMVDGGTVRLPQIVGLGRALELILTGRPLGAQEALSWGLLNRVVSRGKHIEQSVELGHVLAEFPPTALLNDRRSVYAALGQDVAAALRYEAVLGAQTLQSGEANDGVQSFVQGKGRGGRFD